MKQLKIAGLCLFMAYMSGVASAYGFRFSHAGLSPIFSLYEGKRHVMSVFSSGDVEFGEGISPNEAAKAFAREIKASNPFQSICTEQ